MLQYGNANVWISIDGVPAEEYQVEFDGNKVTCWIASETGKNYVIHYQHWAPYIAVYRPTIDGHRFPGMFSTYPTGRSEHINGVRVSSTTKRPFMFAPLTLTDEETSINSGSVQNIGEIQLAIFRGIEKPRNRLTPWGGTQVPEPVTLNEKMKKGIDHQTQYGAALFDVYKPPDVSYQNVGDPLVTFCFKYRPIAVLRANEIAPMPPRPPSPIIKQERKPIIDDDVMVISDDEPAVYKRKYKGSSARKKTKVKVEPKDSL